MTGFRSRWALRLFILVGMVLFSSCAVPKYPWSALPGKTLADVSKQVDDYLSSRGGASMVYASRGEVEGQSADYETFPAQWTIFAVCADGPTWQKSHHVQFGLIPTSIVDDELRQQIESGVLMNELDCDVDGGYQYFSSPYQSGGTSDSPQSVK